MIGKENGMREGQELRMPRAWIAQHEHARGRKKRA
jgi:hypothetical protein